MNQTLINCFNSIDRKSITNKLPLEDIFNLIKCGNVLTDGIIEKARFHGKGSDEYDLIKKTQLQNFAFNFLFNETVQEDNIISPTGLLFLDVDQIQTDDELNLIKKNIAKLPFVVACWVSLSGKGLGFLVRVDGMTSENYSAFKDYFTSYFNGNDILLGYILDNHAFKTTQRTVLTRDEKIYINYDAVSVNYMDVSAINNQSSSDTHNPPLSILIGKEYNVEHLMSCSDNTIDNNVFNNQSSSDIYNPSLGILIGKEYNVEHLMSCSDRKYTSIKFSNEDAYVLAEDEAYMVHKDKVPVINIYLPKGGKIQDGERHRTIFLIACKLLAINGKEKKQDILRYLLYLQKNHCEKPETFKEKEVKTILDRAIKNFDLTKIKPRFKRITFNSAMGYTAKEKQRMGANAVAEIKRSNTIELLNKHYSPDISQKKLSELSGVSERTVQRYWNVSEDGTVLFKQKKNLAPAPTDEALTEENHTLQLSATTISMVMETMNENMFTDEKENEKLDKFLGRVSTATGTDYFGSYANKNKEPKPLTKEEMEWAESLNWDEIFDEGTEPVECKAEVLIEQAPPFTADMFEWIE